MEDMDNMEDDIYYVEILNNKRFKGIYVNKKVMLEKENADEEEESIYDKYGFKDVNTLINSIFELKRKSGMSFIKQEIVVDDYNDNDNDDEYLLLKHYFLGDEDENIDIEDDIDIDDLF